MFKPNNLAVVIAHGLYHTAAAYQPLIEAFAAQSVAAYCPQLPSSDFNHLNVGDVQNPDFDRPPPDGGYPQGDEDVEALLAVLKALIEEQGKEVLLLAHSAGGWTATQAAVSALQKNVRKAEGKEGGVVGLLFYSGFVIPVGESIHSFFQPKDGSTVVVPDWLQFHVSILPSYLLNTSGNLLHPILKHYCFAETRRRRPRNPHSARKIPLP
jgi:pimeloyl-ACP methyl ester carboxylesterase